ncbi:caspase family protein [Mesorhizobium sp. M1005]|uniref:caspase family protein n=1 Tax=unclassified Mesorhizobium TaxID=325217 RepID=UPI003336B0C0
MTHAPDDYALVIGVNDYPEWNKGAKSLKGSVKDATDFRDWLIHKDGGGLAPENAKLVVSTVEPLGPRQWMIDDAFRAIRNQSEGKLRRRFYFYFTGHGHSRAGSWQQQSLCLANWSPLDAGAALHLESYIKASIGCLKFSESVFFLDCCRVRAVVPLGQQSELECGDPDARHRYSAILFGSDQYEPTFEGEVNEEIRGYFTAGLLTVLKQGTIELSDLLDRLRIIVPDLARPKEQTVRAVPADTKIYLGPPDRKPLLEKYADGGKGVGTQVSISVKSNLTGSNTEQDAPTPRPGDISIIRDDFLIARGVGSVSKQLIPGHYQVRIDHAEASITYDIDVGDQPVEQQFDLPRRASATLLSSTIDKHEWLTDPVVDASKWDASQGGQAIFVSVRSRQPGDATPMARSLSLSLNNRGKNIAIYEGNSLHLVEPGTSDLLYFGSEGDISILPIPIAKGWDTHVFILTYEGRPQLPTASISMRPSGVGFDPSDALIDAYERGIADLVTGGPGPDPETLDYLLWGKYRNPLFGLLGAHFLIRKLRRDPKPDPNDLQRLAIVVENLGELLGADAPDVVALRLWRQLISKEWPREPLAGHLPLFNVGFQAFIEATASSDAAMDSRLDDVALGLDGNSPWTLWRPARTSSVSASWSLYPTPHTTFHLESESIGRLKAIEKLWRRDGFVVESTQAGSLRKLRAIRPEGHRPRNFDAASQANTILSIPDWVVSYMREAVKQSTRTGGALDLSRLVRRTMLPMNVLVAAKSLAEQSEDDGGVVEPIRSFGTAPPVD